MRTLHNTAGLLAWRVDFDLVIRCNNCLLEQWSMVSDLIMTTGHHRRSTEKRRWATSTEEESWSRRDWHGDVGKHSSSETASSGAI